MVVIHMDTMRDTGILSKLYEGMDCKVFLNPDYSEKDNVMEAVKSDDLVIITGHGDANGLYGVDMNGYFIDASDADVLRGRKVIGIWCYASEFADRYGLEGFFTSMFISNAQEFNEIFLSREECATDWEIERETGVFCKRVNCLVANRFPMERWVEILQAVCEKHIPYVRYNYEALSYFDGKKKKTENK